MKKILLAYDGSGPAHRALQTAADLVAKHDATLTIVSVVPTHFGLDALSAPFDDVPVHRKQLSDAVAYLEVRGIRPETLEPHGEPARIIASIARKDGYDTVVLGSRGLGATSRFLLGSVSAYVAAHSRATVVIVH